MEALLGLLRSAREQQPATRELPRDEEAAEAAEIALHALLVLLTGEEVGWLRLRAAQSRIPCAPEWCASACAIPTTWA